MNKTILPAAFASIMMLLFTGCQDNSVTLAENDNKVIIGSYDSFPTAVCTTDKGNKLIVPNGTQGEVVKWNEIYKTGKETLFASIDMQATSDVKILNGPLKGKTCAISHAYITLQ